MKEEVDFQELIQKKNFISLRNTLSKLNPASILEVIRDFKIEDVVLIIRIAPKEVAAELFSLLTEHQKEDIIENLSEKEILNILENLHFDDMIDVLDEVPANVSNKFLSLREKKNIKIINQLLHYKDGTAGALLTIEYVHISEEMTCGEALKQIRDTADNKETIYTVYVTNAERVLNGVMSLKEIIVNKENTLIKDVMKKHDIIHVSTNLEQEEVARLFKRYDFNVLPVLDQEGKMVGIITVDDIVDVIEEEATEDIEKMAAINPLDKHYFETATLEMVFKRLPWLIVLMISSTFTASIISHYEDALQKLVILTSFIPLLMDTAGNAGSQSSTLIVRGIAIGTIRLKDIFRVIFKEFRVSFLVGISLAVINFLKLYFLDSALISRPDRLIISLLVSCTLVVTIVAAKMLGGILPLLAKACKMDPALMASPLITTVVDVLSLLSYFNLAKVMINGI